MNFSGFVSSTYMKKTQQHWSFCELNFLLCTSSSSKLSVCMKHRRTLWLWTIRHRLIVKRKGKVHFDRPISLFLDNNLERCKNTCPVPFGVSSVFIYNKSNAMWICDYQRPSTQKPIVCLFSIDWKWLISNQSFDSIRTFFNPITHFIWFILYGLRSRDSG